jgi:hypothetical protein
MKSTVLWALIALNAMLATTFALRLIKPNVAYAQNNRPGDYIMLPGNAIGQSGAMIYIIDQSSQQLSGLIVNQKGGLEGVKPIDLQHAFSGAEGNAGAKKPPKR